MEFLARANGHDKRLGSEKSFHCGPSLRKPYDDSGEGADGLSWLKAELGGR